MGPAQLDDAGFDLGTDLVRIAVGLGAVVGEGRQSLVRVAEEPAVNGPAIDPMAGCDIGDRGPFEHLPDGVVALLNHRKLHQHDHVLLGSVEHK
jgi:hypothetical protein